MNDVIQFGDTGEEVLLLQQKLKILGFYPALLTGSFGLSTEEGVKAFQTSVGLEETGIVNKVTWDAITERVDNFPLPISIYPTLSYGATGSFVIDLQTKLKALLYYTEDINSTFDLETENAVKRFQFNNDLTANGIVDSATWNQINSSYGNLNACALENGNGSDNTEGATTNYVSYTVVPGDTLYAIARRYDVTVDELKEINQLTSNTLQIGQILKIPTKDEEDYFSYTVVPGDTLYAIARRYNTTVSELKKINQLTSNTLQIGQILKIPTVQEESFIRYVVQGNDTLYSIARRYNITVDELKKINNLTSNTLQIGQVLKIPTTKEEEYIFYTVTKGDTLYAIAQRYDTTVNAIKQLNQLTSNTLQIGQTLKIPV